VGLYHPSPSPRCLLRWGLAPCASCSWSSAPRAFYPVPSPPGLWKSIFCRRRPSIIMGWTSTGPRRSLLPPGCLVLLLYPQNLSPWPCLRCLGHSWASTMSGYIIQASEGSGLPPRGLATHRIRPLSGTKSPSGHPHTNAFSKLELLNPRGFTAWTLPKDTSFVGAWPLAIVATGAFTHRPRLLFFDHWAWTLLCFHHPGCNISARMT
jgi:hypothetical protein